MFIIALKKIISLIITILLVITSNINSGLCKRNDNIVVLYTNDVHCAVDTNIGYAGLKSYKTLKESETPYVTLVDCGDAVQGSTIGAVSRGEYLVDIMNYVGYDFAVLGNHEFDYDMKQTSKYIEKANYKYLGCNITYSGSEENLLKDVEPYSIVNYKNDQVAFIGISTPYSVTTSIPASFMDEDGNYVYGFSEDNFYETIQNTIDECTDKGADYIVVMGHTGDLASYSPYASVDIIENTEGIDAYLDAHEHAVINERIVNDKNGNPVVLSSTGSELTNIGELTITPDGKVSTKLISDYSEKDADTTAFIENIKEEYNVKNNTPIFNNPVDLKIYEDGIRKIRNRECNIGNLVADGYRDATGADIALVNGGSIRADLDQGPISFNDIITVHPFGNKVVSLKATGKQIIDALEFSTMYVESEYKNGSAAVGENGGFFQVSGISYTVDTSIMPSIETDSLGRFISVNGERRVKNVLVEGEGNTMVPIDLNKEYVVTSNNYILFSQGDGFTMFANNEKVISDGLNDYEVLISFFLSHSEQFIEDNYSSVQNRVVIM